ncbi:MAG: ABC transporter ATP-binding protein [Candidatus Omnitrophica bacterium]|nr:ABC transporter ATP-binding protein [Candidatus Omnitrophota bacterium]
MLKRDSSIRNTNADKVRMDLFKSNISILNVFSSAEMRIIGKYLRPYLKWIIVLIFLALGFSFLEGGKAISVVGFIRAMFGDGLSKFKDMVIMGYRPADHIQFNDKHELAFALFGAFIGLGLISVVVKYIVSYLTRKFQLNLMRNLRRDLYNKIVSFNIDFFNEAKSGEILFMVNSEVSRFSAMIQHSKGLLSASCTMLVFLIILFSMMPLVTAVITAFGAIFLFLHQIIERRLKISSWNANLHLNTLQQIFYEIIYGMKLIKLGGLEEREREEYLNYHSNFEREDMNMIKLKLNSVAAREAFFILCLAIFSFTFSFLLKRGIIIKDSSFIVSYMVLLLWIVPSFSEFQSAILNIVQSYGPLSKIAGILTKPADDSTRTGDIVLNETEGIEDLKVKDIGFSYKGKDAVLKSIDTTFSKGKTYAVVGFSGEGKSTLLDLLVGIRRPHKGNILLNNTEINRIESKSLMEKIGYVNQEPLVFHDTIKENVTFFNRDVSQSMIDSALEMASIKDFVYSSKEGLDTQLGERGLTVSGGERQRIGLARVFLKDADILLLDEATNSLDYKTEKEIYDNLKRIKDNKIIIVVAHRLSSLVDFDEIIVLYGGRVEERGAHRELMEKKGVYHSLYKLQEAGKDV